MADKRKRVSLQAEARRKTEDAVQALADLMTNGASETARVAAAKEILERGWGKAKPLETKTKGAEPTKEVVVFEWQFVDPPR